MCVLLFTSSANFLTLINNKKHYVYYTQLFSSVFKTFFIHTYEVSKKFVCEHNKLHDMLRMYVYNRTCYTMLVVIIMDFMRPLSI